MFEILLSIAVFTGIILSLSALVLLARSRLVATGDVRMVINGDRTFDVAAGVKLLTALREVGLHLPAGCGGKGTCGQCRATVLDGGGQMLPTEASLLGRGEAARHVRLACQVAVREDIRVVIPEEVLGVQAWTCKVRSTRGLSPFIKEIVLELPAGEEVPFRAGGYIQVECPPFRVSFADFDIEEPLRADWDRMHLWRLEAGTSTPTTRAYSMANYPEEKGVIMLAVGIALPPPGAEDVPPGVVSSYLFGLRRGDDVTITGPYGEFFAHATGNEMVFIGGGTGMAPLRSHIFDQLKRIGSKRKISFFFGARSERHLLYHEEFLELAEQYENFTYTAALSEPDEDGDWTGPVGFIHQVAFDQYLGEHDAPEDVEYYLCGPPLMIAAVERMVRDLGVPEDNVVYDKFG